MHYIDTLQATILQHLQDGAGLTEYELLQRLLQQGYFEFLNKRPYTSHELFCGHFLLFHCLYRLRDHLWKKQLGHLEISAMRIAIQPYQSGDLVLVQADPLRSYYLDLNHLTETTAQQVDELIASFWIRMDRQDGRSEALACLGLQDPVADGEIRVAYRKLVMQHHPDRGGCDETLKQLNWAMEKLGL